MTTNEPPLAPGATIEGRYVVGEIIGRGGGGTVCAGHHLALDAPVAIKFLKPQELARDARKRFLREARLANRLRSEHATRVYDVGELPTGDLFLVMERLYGRALDAELSARGPFPEHEAAEVVAQACEALAEAHGQGIVHRDIKLGNLFLHADPLLPPPRRPVLKVLDFGLARDLDRVDSSGPQRTRTFMFLGTPRYMAPEQWEAGVMADPRMDLYSIGVVLHELLTGRVPFEERSPHERAVAILEGALPDPRIVRPDISPRMAEIVMSCVRPRPEDRVPSARHLERLLRALAAGQEGGAGATLILSNVVQTKALPAAENPHRAASTSSSAPPKLKPTSVVPPQLSHAPPAPQQASPSHQPPAYGAPPMGMAPPTSPPPGMPAPAPTSDLHAMASQTPGAPLPTTLHDEDDDDDEPAPLDRVVVGTLVLVLLILVALGVLTLLRATGHV